MIKKIVLSLLIAALIALVLANKTDINSPAWGQDKDWKEFKLQYSNDWNTLKNILTPTIQFTEITDGYFPLPNIKNPEGFRCVAEENKAYIDMDGDDKAEREITTAENLIDFDITLKDGTKSKYQMRIWKTMENDISNKPVPHWYYQRACFMRGKVLGDDIILIDENGNGRYNDLLQDTICILGSNKITAAGLLTRFLIVKSKLYELKIDETGTKISAKEYKGPTGKLDVLKGLNFDKNMPLMVTFQGAVTSAGNKSSENDNAKNKEEEEDDNGPDSISVEEIESTFKKPVTQKHNEADNTPTIANTELSITIFPNRAPAIVPAGEYELLSALFSKQVRVRKGSFKSFKVEEKKDAVLRWGGPFKLVLNPIQTKTGMIYTFIPPALYKSPQIVEQKIDCPFIFVELPKVISGANGEEYFSPSEFKDRQGNNMPDTSINNFDVNISAKEPAKGSKFTKGQQLNTGNEFIGQWKMWDPSGLVSKSEKEWINPYYECPLYDYLGTVIIKVSTNSAIYDKVTFEKEIEITKE